MTIHNINGVPSLIEIEKMIDDNDLDGAAAALSKLEEVIKAAQPTADEDELDDCDDDEELDDEEDDGEMDDTVQKLGGGGGPYPHDDLIPALTENHQNMHPMRTSTHELPFDRTVAMIAARDQVPQTVALQRARTERPSEFLAWQRLHQPLYNKPWYKSAPAAPLTWEDAVQNEINKGCDNRCVAETRVQHQFGNLLPRTTINKGDTLIVKFMRACDQLMQSNPGINRTEAMQMVRKADPEAFEVFSLV